MNLFMVEWLGRGARPCELCQLGLSRDNYGAGASWETKSNSFKIQMPWSTPSHGAFRCWEGWCEVGGRG